MTRKNRYRLVGLPGTKKEAVVGRSGNSSTMPAAYMKQAGIGEALTPSVPPNRTKQFIRGAAGLPHKVNPAPH